jgi:hypothetical protein
MIAWQRWWVVVLSLFACARPEYSAPPIAFFEEITPKTIHTWIQACPRPLWIRDPDPELIVECLNPKRPMLERTIAYPVGYPRYPDEDEIEFEVVVVSVDDTWLQIMQFEIMTPDTARREAIADMIAENVAPAWRERMRTGLKQALRLFKPTFADSWDREYAQFQDQFPDTYELFGGFAVTAFQTRPRVTIRNPYAPWW